MSAREVDKMYVYTSLIRKNTFITIIYPEEKMMLNDKNQLRSTIQSTVMYYKSLLEQEKMKWKGESLECRTKQMKNLVERHFYIDYSVIPEKLVKAVIEDMI